MEVVVACLLVQRSQHPCLLQWIVVVVAVVVVLYVKVVTIVSWKVGSRRTLRQCRLRRRE